MLTRKVPAVAVTTPDLHAALPMAASNDSQSPIPSTRIWQNVPIAVPELCLKAGVHGDLRSAGVRLWIFLGNGDSIPDYDELRQ